MFYGLKIKAERLKFTTKAYGSTPKRSFTPTLHKSKRYSTPPQTKKSARITRALPNLRVFDVNINTTERSDPLHSSGREGT